MKKSDFMLQVILELVKRDGTNGNVDDITYFAKKLCEEIERHEKADNKGIFEGFEVDYPKLSRENVERYKNNTAFTVTATIDPQSVSPVPLDIEKEVDALFGAPEDFFTQFPKPIENTDENNLLFGISGEYTPEWKPENVKVNDYVGFHYEGYRDQEGKVTFISKKIVPELSITTKDGKTWKVSRDNIFDPAKLLER